MKGRYVNDIKTNRSARGEADWDQVRTNFEWLEEQIGNIQADLKMMMDRRPRFTRAVLSEGINPVTILEPKDHENCRLVSAFAQAADNVALNNIIVLAADGGAIAKEVIIKAGEKSGKVQRLWVSKHATIGRYEKVVVIPSSVRKVIVTTEWEEI